MKIIDFGMRYKSYNDDTEETGIEIAWEDEDLLFGNLTLDVDLDGLLTIDAENISKETFLKIMSAAYDHAKVV